MTSDKSKKKSNEKDTVTWERMDDDLNRSLCNCTFAKTVLMLLVILYHSCVFWTGTWWDTDPAFDSAGLKMIALWLNSFHIYGFTLISGYLFAYKVLKGGYNVFGPFIKNKVLRLIVPYVFVAIIWLIPVSVALFHISWEKIVSAYFLCTFPEQLWFLWMLFGVFVIAWPLRWVFLNRPKVGYLIAVVLYGIGIIGKKMLPNVFCFWTACQYVMFFFIGMRVRVKEEKGEKMITKIIPCYCWIAIDAMAFAGMMLFGQHIGIVWKALSICLNFVLHVVGAIMAWTTLQAIAKKIQWESCGFFKTLSFYSMPMYLFHQQLIYFSIILLNGKVNPWINAGANFFIAIVGSLSISAVLMKWKTTRMLIGEK